MAPDVVVLLSDDADHDGDGNNQRSPGIFVTPNTTPAARRVSIPTAEPSLRGVVAMQHSEVIPIEDTPAHLTLGNNPLPGDQALARLSLFQDWSSDDMLPSPRPRNRPALRQSVDDRAVKTSDLRSRPAKRRRLGSPGVEIAKVDDLLPTYDGKLDSRDSGPSTPHTRWDKPAASVEYIDLLSSPDVDTSRIEPTSAAAPAVDSDFADINDLLLPPMVPPLPEPKTGQTTASLAPRHDEQLDDDIIMLSSSPCRPTDRDLLTRPTAQRRQPLQRSFSEGQALALSDEDDDELEGVYGNAGLSASQNIDALLAAWRKDRQRPAVQPPQMAQHPRRLSLDGASNVAGGPTRPGRPKAGPLPAANDKERDSRRRGRELDREERRKEKEAERERRQKEREEEKERRKIASEVAKEQRARQRAEAAAFNNANRSRVDKAVAAPEMIVRLPDTLSQAIRETTETMLGEIKSSYETYTSPLENVVTWRRKVTAEFKPDLGHWVPVEQRIVDEKHALVVLRGEELVQLILAGQDGAQDLEWGRDARRQTGGHDLNSHIVAMQSTFPGHAVIYLIEGLGSWKSKNRSIRNRQFTAAVRNASGSGTSASSAAAAAAVARAEQQLLQDDQQQQRLAARPSQRLGRRCQAQTAQRHVDEAVVDDAMLDLQVEHEGKILVHETHSVLDSARWIKIFTEQIATAPYRQEQEERYAAAAAFCMDTGQIATGDTADETYTLMLQQIGRVTEPVALGVATRFPSVPKLVRGFAEEGPQALEAVLKSRNRNGALSDRTVGQALSRRIYKVFMGRDPASTDV